MGFKVALEFDEADDFFALLVKLAVPDPAMGGVLTALNSIDGKVSVMSAEFDALKAEVAATRGEIDSATALIQGIAARIEASREDPVALMALVADLRKDREELSQAIMADQATQAPPADGEGTPPDTTPPDDGTTVPPVVDPNNPDAV